MPINPLNVTKGVEFGAEGFELLFSPNSSRYICVVYDQKKKQRYTITPLSILFGEDNADNELNGMPSMGEIEDIVMEREEIRERLRAVKKAQQKNRFFFYC